MSGGVKQLDKGDVVALFEERPAMLRLLVALGGRLRPGVHTDIDGSAFLLGPGAAVLSDQHFVFFNNPVSPDGAVRLLDTGAGAGLLDRAANGDGDERPESVRGEDAITVALREVPPQVQRIRFVLSVYPDERDGQDVSLDDVRDARVRLLDADSEDELARYELGPLHPDQAVVVGDLYRYAGRWKFKALAERGKKGLPGIAGQFGVNV